MQLSVTYRIGADII